MKYDKKFKEKALKLSDKIGLKKAAEELNVEYCTLSSWRGRRDKNLKKRNMELELEIASLRRANEMLKDALRFFTDLP